MNMSPYMVRKTSTDVSKGTDFKIGRLRGTWVAQPVKHPTSAQVSISWFVSSSPVTGSVLTAQSLEPASDSVSSSLSAPSLLVLFLSLSKINKHKKKIRLED